MGHLKKWHSIGTNSKCNRRKPTDAVRGDFSWRIGQPAGPTFQLKHEAQHAFRPVAEDLLGKEAAGHALGYLGNRRIDVYGAGDL